MHCKHSTALDSRKNRLLCLSVPVLFSFAFCAFISKYSLIYVKRDEQPPVVQCLGLTPTLIRAWRSVFVSTVQLWLTCWAYYFQLHDISISALRSLSCRGLQHLSVIRGRCGVILWILQRTGYAFIAKVNKTHFEYTHAVEQPAEVRAVQTIMLCKPSLYKAPLSSRQGSTLTANNDGCEDGPTAYIE